MRDPVFPNSPRIEISEVNESTYRYEGPKPQFKESAIIFFADSIEAASRSLPKVSPQAIDDLLEHIFQDRIDDHQLSECALTFQEFHAIKKSFSFTLLNMFHARVGYPSKAEKEEAIGRTGEADQAPVKTAKPQRAGSEKATPPRGAPKSKAAVTKRSEDVRPEEATSAHPRNQPA